MTSIFSDLLTFGLLAPFIIRVFLGLYFILWGWSTLRKRASNQNIAPFHKYFLSPLSLLGGFLVTVGLFTQVATFFLMGLSIYLFRKDQNHLVFILLFGMALSLLFSGAGFFAFDLPL